MASIESHRSDHLKAGMFVVIALIIFIVTLTAIAGGGSLFHRTSKYVVRFPLDVGAAGLTQGSEVSIGGRQVGRVTSVELAFDTDHQTPLGVDVHVRIEQAIAVFDDASAFLAQPLFGAGSKVNFTSIGGGEGSAQLNEGQIIEGGIAPPLLLRSAGFGPEQVQQLHALMDRLDDTSKRFVTITDTFEQDILPNFSAASESVKSITADIHDRSGLWFDRADTVTKDFTAISANTSAAVDDARAFIAKLHQVVDENRDAARNAVAQLGEASEKADALLDKLNDQSVGLLNDLLSQGRHQLEDTGAVVSRVSSLVAEQEPEVRKTLSNLRLSSDQLKLMTGEIRRSPWRLLYRPKDHELEYELLYDSARTYASAVSDLRAASESLESAVGSDGSRLATDDARPLDDYISEISQAFERYRQAEKKFLNTLMEQQKKP